MNKPKKPGLIVCVQTHGWRKYRCAYTVIESTLIDILVNNKNVVGLRIDNPLLSSYAKGKYKDMFVLGMMKDDKYSNYITPTLEHYNKCIEAGADAVAVDFRNWELVNWAFDTPIKEYIWPDVSIPYEAKALINNHNFPMVSSTFCEDPFAFHIYFMDSEFSDRINIEGNVNHDRFFMINSVRHVTIGRAIHDPNTIIKNLIG